MSSIPQYNVRTLFIVPLVLAFFLSFELPVRGIQTGISPFSQTYNRYRELCGNLKAGRDRWLEVIRSFAAVPQKSSVYMRSRGLFLAGKASLILYAREGKIEDLDSAIRYFNEVKRITRHKSRLTAILRELRTAHQLRRNHSMQIHGLCPPAGLQSVESMKGRQRIAKPQPKTIKMFGRRPTRRSCRVVSNQERSSRRQRLSDVYQGNPFCPRRRTEPFRPRPRVKTVSLPGAIAPTVATVPVRRKEAKRPFIVVIDPGHGGKDPGAVSSDGKQKEKDITLSIAKRLKKRLAQKIPNINVKLTRTDDRFLAVTKRTAAANSLNADLFISIHCNSYSDSSAQGIETYYLSKARSEQAMRVAARENDIPLSRMSDLEATLLDLMMTSKKSESEKLAETVHEALVRRTSGWRSAGRDRGVKRGPFYVLLGATMPAILVECGYISNWEDRRRLSDKRYQDSVARAIASGVQTYLNGLGRKG